jgi:hypothetical protein
MGQRTGKCHVLLVGSYHMANPGLDAIQLEVNVRQPHRQAEIGELLARLARFEPTRIAVEVNRTNQEELDLAYQRYRSGQAPLTR